MALAEEMTKRITRRIADKNAVAHAEQQRKQALESIVSQAKPILASRLRALTGLAINSDEFELYPDIEWQFSDPVIFCALGVHIPHRMLQGQKVELKGIVGIIADSDGMQPTDVFISRNPPDLSERHRPNRYPLWWYFEMGEQQWRDTSLAALLVNVCECYNDKATEDAK